MTGAEFSEVDIDLLADYVGGALDGTPDEAVVTALITEDVAWRDAHDRLSAGAASVTDQLRALGSIAEPMPVDIFARLDAALLDATNAENPTGATNPTGAENAIGAAAGPAAMEPGSDGAAPVRHLVAVPSGSRSRRARRLRWAAPVGIAAGVLAFVGFGFQQQFAGDSSQDTAASAGNAAEAPSAPQAAAGAERGLMDISARIVESGTDYRLATLSQSVALSRTAANLPQDQVETMTKAAPSAGMITMDAPLDRLRVQEALGACIDAIAAQHGAGEIVPKIVDFARFDGAPAVIVEFTATDGSWVWASGPACGTPEAGAAKLGAVKVG